MTLWILAAVALAAFLLWLEPVTKEEARLPADTRRAEEKSEPVKRAETPAPEPKQHHTPAKVAEPTPWQTVPQAPVKEASNAQSTPPREPAPPVPPKASPAPVEQAPASAPPAAPRAEKPKAASGEKPAETTALERAFTPPQAAPKPLFAPPPKVETRDITPGEEAAARKNAAPQVLALNREATKGVAPLPETPPTAPPPSTAPVMGRAAIVIDDFGIDIEAARKFLALPIQITLSVMPFERHSREICDLAYSRGHEVILHLPMEPQSFPSKKVPNHMLTLSMNPEEMTKFISQAVFTTPHITGVNNHQGSRFTEKADAMAVVMKDLKDRGLYFFDSRTSAKSIGATVARRLSVPTGQRDIFLDHSQSETFVRSQMELLIRKARVEGAAIAIGHPHPVTLKVLTESVERLRREGIEIVPLKQFMTVAEPRKPTTSVPLGRD